MLQQRDASIVHWPSTICRLVNALIWGSYGLLINQLIIIIPPGVCILVCTFELLECLCLPGTLPKHMVTQSSEEDEEAGDVKSKASEADTDVPSDTLSVLDPLEGHLVDLTSRLEEAGIYEDYLRFQKGYLKWRRGAARGAKGELTKSNVTNLFNDVIPAAKLQRQVLECNTINVRSAPE